MNLDPTKDRIPVRVQRRRTKGWKMPDNTVYVGRGSKWGNPFVVGKDGTLQECLKKYRDSLVPYTSHQRPIEDYFVSILNIDEIKSKLSGKNLACWCQLNQPCHADILLEIANS